MFEQHNEGKVSVNVYFIDPDEGKSILLYRKSKVLKSTHHILEDGDNYHYVFIKDFNKLM